MSRRPGRPHLVTRLLEALGRLAATLNAMPLVLGERSAAGRACRHRDGHDDGRREDALERDLGQVIRVAEREDGMHVRPRIRHELLELRESGRIVIADELARQDEGRLVSELDQAHAAAGGRRIRTLWTIRSSFSMSTEMLLEATIKLYSGFSSTGPVRSFGVGLAWKWAISCSRCAAQ